MDKLFRKRQQAWHTQNIKYLRYVFNDHFVLFLTILLGALAVQYAQFLQHNHLPFYGRMIVLVIVSIVAIFVGRIATFMEAPDKVFLLVKEKIVKKHLINSLVKSLILPAIVMIILIFIAAPLVKFDLIDKIIWFVILLIIKIAQFSVIFIKNQKNGQILWENWISQERRRQMSILRFFALFTTVKGISAHSKRRKYLDFLLPKTKRTYEYLFARSFLRSGDYLGLTIRLIVLQILALIFIPNAILATLLVLVLNYLLIFQLISLRESYDYQLLTQLYPVRKNTKKIAIRSILLRIVVLTTIIQLIFGLIFLNTKWYVIAFLIMNFILIKFYVNWRLKK